MKVGALYFRRTNHRNAIAAGAVVVIANTPREFAEVSGCRDSRERKILRLDHNVVISEAMEFDKPRRHFIQPASRPS
jgi:hypothetical protein